MIYIDETRKPLFTSRKEQRTIKTRMEPVNCDATGAVACLIGAVICVLVMGFICSPWCPEWLYIRGIWRAGAETLYVMVAPGSTLNGRVEPDKHSDRCARFEAGDALELVDYRDGWYQVEGSEYGTCWVNGAYVSDAPEPAPKAARIASNGRVALRDKPDGNLLKWLENGHSVTLEATVNGWARVTGGYVMAEFVEEVEP